MKRKLGILFLVILAFVCAVTAIACNGKPTPPDPSDPEEPTPPGPSYTTMEEYAEALANDPFLTGVPGDRAENPRVPLDENWSKLQKKKQPIVMDETVTETFDKDYFSSSFSPANGTYQGGTYYITDGDEAVSPGNSSLVFLADGPANGGNFDRITLKGRKLVAGAYYRLEVKAKVLTTGKSFWFYQTVDGVSGTALFNLSSDTQNQVLEKESYFLATSGDSHLMILVEQGNDGDKMAFDDISLTRVDTPPLIKDLAVTRTGDTFRASYRYYDDEDDVLTSEEIRWFAALDRNGTRKTVLATSGKELTLDAARLTAFKGQYIGFEVRPVNAGASGNKGVFATAYAPSAISGAADYGVFDISSGDRFTDDFEALQGTGSLLPAPSIGASYLASYLSGTDAIDGNYSLFLSTDPAINSGCDLGGLSFANGGYKVKVSFDFKVLAKTGGTRDFNFYVQFRARDNGYGYDVHNNGSVGVSDPEIGKTYRYSGVFELKNIGGYYMSFFTSFAGVDILIDNVSVQRYESSPVDLTRDGVAYTENFGEMKLEVCGNSSASEFTSRINDGKLNINFKTPTKGEMAGFVVSNFDVGANAYLNVKLVFEFTSTPAYTQDLFLLINGAGPQFAISALERPDGKYEIDYVFKQLKPGAQNEIALVTHYVDSENREITVIVHELKLAVMNPVENDFDETGSVTSITNVGNKYLENFEEVPAGVAFDQEYGSTLVSKGYKYNADSILGTSLYLSAADRSRQPWLIVNGLTLGTNLKFRISFDVRFIGTLPAQVKATLQKLGAADIATAVSLSDFVSTEGVYRVSFLIANDDAEGRRLLLQFAGEGTDEIAYYLDNFSLEAVSAVPAFDVAEKTVSDRYVGAEDENLSYLYTGKEGAAVSLTSEGLDVSGTSTGFCGVTYSGFRFSDGIVSMTVKIKLVKTTDFAANFMLLVNGGGVGYDQQFSSDKPLNEEFTIEHTVTFLTDEIPTSINFVACYSSGQEIGFLVKEFSVTAHGGGFDEIGFKTALTEKGDYYRENFDALPDGVVFDIEYGGAEKEFKTCEQLSGNALYINWTSGTPYLILNGISLGAGLTYELEFDVCAISGAVPTGLRAVLQKSGASDIDQTVSLVQVGDIYKVKLTLRNDDVTGRRLIMGFQSDSTPYGIAIDNFSLTAI